MAERAVTATGKNEDGDITALSSSSRTWSRVSKQDAIGHIQAGAHTYFVPWTTGRTEIRVVQGPSGLYLRTDRDGTERNNLRDLPNC